MRKIRACLETDDFWLENENDCGFTRLYLKRRETEILHALAAAKGATVSARRIYNNMDLDENITWDRHIIYNNICHLRKKLGHESIISREKVGWVLNMDIELVKWEDAFGK